MTPGVRQRLDLVTVVAVRCRGGDWPRGLLAETPVPDTWMGLVVRADGGRRFVPAGEDPRPGREDTLVLVRNRAISVPIELEDTPSADHHGVHAEVELLVRCPPREDELAALHRTLLGEAELTLEGLAAHVHAAGAPAALQAFIREQSAQNLVHNDQRDALLDSLSRALAAFLFASGLILERLGRVEFHSASLTREEQHRRSTARRADELAAKARLEEAALAATRRRLDALGDVLTKLQAAATGHTDLQWRTLLPALLPSERGRLLESLWRLTPDRTVAVALVVVAGRQCLWLDPTQPEQIVRRVDVPDDLGGLRSVTFDRDADALLVGAATGVWHLDPADGRVVSKFAVATKTPPRTGFNAAVIRDRRLLATHSELGAWLWEFEEPREHQPIHPPPSQVATGDSPWRGGVGGRSQSPPPAPSSAVPPAEESGKGSGPVARPLLTPVGGIPKTIRAATADDHGHLVFAADNRVLAFGSKGEPLWTGGPAESAIHCLAVLDEHLYAGTSTGTLLRCDLARPGEWLIVHRQAGPIESVCPRRWDDLVELVIPAGAQGISGVYAEEGIVARLMDCPLPIRRAWACDDALVGLTEPRDRLLVLTGAMAGRAGREVPIARLTGRPIQDVCIVTQREAQPFGAESPSNPNASRAD